MSKNTLVTVAIQTYNQEAYIEKCLKSVLAQKTSFPFEIIIGEDESNDGTREICKKYAKKYPSKIRLFLRSRKDVIYINGNPTGRYNFIENLKAAKGKYIALCDGDDYWTNPLKLQKQVDFLEKNPSVAICHHKVKKYFQKTKKYSESSPPISTLYSIYELLKENKIVSSSCMFRNRLFNYFPAWFYKAPYADYALHILNAQKGKIAYLEDEMAIYRIHSKGIWSLKKKSNKSKSALKFLEFLRDEVINKEDLKKALSQNIFRHHYRIAYSSARNSQDFFNHFKYCLKNAKTSTKHWKSVIILGLYYLNVLEYHEDKGLQLITYNKLFPFPPIK